MALSRPRHGFESRWEHQSAERTGRPVPDFVFAFLDCEFGGLDPEQHDITEVAVVVTDYRLAEQSSAEWKIRARPERVANKLTVGEIELDRDGHRVTRNGREVRLGPTEYRLLEYLMQSPGRVFSRAQLLDGVWGRDIYVDERTVDVHIGRLRKSIIRGRERDPIRTVRGAGYSIIDEARVEA